MGGRNSKAKKEAKKDVKKEVTKQVAGSPVATATAPATALAAVAAPGVDGKAHVLVIYANSEPKSFCAAMKNTIVDTLTKHGHEVKVSDLYALKWFDPLDRGDFTKLEDPDYFKPQAEQAASNVRGMLTFSPAVRAEHEKVKWSEIMIFVFPLYWWGFPGIMKNWIDRVFSMKFAYGQGDISLVGRKAMVVYSTGSSKQVHNDTGMEPAMWKMMHQGVFQFCSLTSLLPFVAYQSAWVDDPQRQQYLKELSDIMANIDERKEYEIT